MLLRRAPPALAAVGLALGLALAASPPARGEDGRAAAAERSAGAASSPARTKASRKVRRKKRLVPARGASRLAFVASARSGPEPLVDDASLPPRVPGGACPPDMANIEKRYCVDRYEASLVEMSLLDGEHAFSPYEPVGGRDVRAVSVAGVVPQGYVSGKDAAAACARSGKRLCKAAEWRKACAGPRAVQYGYAATRERGRCNDAGRSPMIAIFHIAPDAPPGDWDPVRMNDPRLNQVAGALALTGAHPSCTNEFGVFDMVGNLHEWIDDPDGTFQGGYYLDTTINGEGCGYRTSAHEVGYHDYSTGFRCCAEVTLEPGAEGEGSSRSAE